MWFVFLLAAMSVALCAMLLVYIGNKVFLSIRKENENYIKEKENEKNGNER